MDPPAWTSLPGPWTSAWRKIDGHAPKMIGHGPQMIGHGPQMIGHGPQNDRIWRTNYQIPPGETIIYVPCPIIFGACPSILRHAEVQGPGRQVQAGGSIPQVA
eukprot:gene17614-biopygen20388